MRKGVVIYHDEAEKFLRNHWTNEHDMNDGSIPAITGGGFVCSQREVYCGIGRVWRQ